MLLSADLQQNRMTELKDHLEFRGFNIQWVEENVPLYCDLEHLERNRASPDEIKSAKPCTDTEKQLICFDTFLERNVSSLLRLFALDFIHKCPLRSFYFYLKHFRTKKNKILTGIRVEISSKPFHAKTFRIWFRYDIHDIPECNEMVSELHILLKHLSKEKTLSPAPLPRRFIFKRKNQQRGLHSHSQSQI